MTPAASRRLPTPQIESVVGKLYADADRLDWEHLTPKRRTAQYDLWVSDQAIGGVLTAYMSAENARSWIKDGPMKEYSRALVGAGRYAKFSPGETLTAGRVVSTALGNAADVVANSEGIKPFHCLAEIDDRTVFVAWDRHRNLRNLVWACINYLSEHSVGFAEIVILETFDLPTTAEMKERHKKISTRCEIGFSYFRLQTPREPGGHDQ